MPTAEDPPQKRSAARRPLGRGPGVLGEALPDVRVTDTDDAEAVADTGAASDQHGGAAPARDESTYAAEYGEDVAEYAAVEGPAEAVDGSATAGAEHGAGPALSDPEHPNGAFSGPGSAPGPDERGTGRREASREDEGQGGEGKGGEDRDGEDRDGAEESADGRFTVVLDNFEGPFDLLLQLISKHKLDVTEVALSRVTDEFMAHIRAMGEEWDLDQTTEFLVVAATLLDLKAARLLPTAEVEDEADLALLEARDLLFARLLQYRAYKEVARIFAERTAAEERRYPRTVGLEPQHAELLPEVALRIGPEGFAQLAVKAMRPKPKPQVYVEHIHAPLVSVREQAEVLVSRLRELDEATFQALTADAPDVLTVVARFLALLELYRERAVELEQPEALGELSIRWSGGEAARPVVTDEFDQPVPAADDKAGNPGK